MNTPIVPRALKNCKSLLNLNVMPKISGIITTHKNPPVLPRSIGSVIAQTFKDWELLVVYDGRADEETQHNVAEYARRDPGIKPLIEIEPFGGPAKPRNIGVAHAK